MTSIPPVGGAAQILPNTNPATPAVLFRNFEATAVGGAAQKLISISFAASSKEPCRGAAQVPPHTSLVATTKGPVQFQAGAAGGTGCYQSGNPHQYPRNVPGTIGIKANAAKGAAQIPGNTPFLFSNSNVQAGTVPPTGNNPFLFHNINVQAGPEP